MSPAAARDVPRSYPARRCIPSPLPLRPDIRAAIHLRRELSVGFVLDVDRCRASRQDIARHEGLIAQIRAMYADDPDSELALAKPRSRTELTGST